MPTSTAKKKAAHRKRVTGTTGAFRFSATSGYCPLPVTGDTYRGCTHNCLYCYERQTPNQHLRQKGVQPRDHATMFKSLSEDVQIREWTVHYPVALRIGVLSDPYPAMESWYGNTDRLVKLLSRLGYQVQMSTKNPGGITDEHLETLQKAPKAMVRVSFSTLDDDLSAVIEPGAPRPSERLAGMRRLADAGIEVGVRNCPLIHSLPETFDAKTYETYRSAGANNFTCELYRFSVTWRHTWDPLQWTALLQCERPPGYDTLDWRVEMKDKTSRMRRWAERAEKAFFGPLQTLERHKYCSGGYNFVFFDPYKTRVIFERVRGLAHKAGMRFGICSMGDGMQQVDLNDGPCGCITDGWLHDEGALAPDWHTNRWKGYLLPDVLQYGANCGLARFVCANDATLRPLVLESEHPSRIVPVTEATPYEASREVIQAAGGPGAMRSYDPVRAGKVIVE